MQKVACRANAISSSPAPAPLVELFFGHQYPSKGQTNPHQSKHSNRFVPSMAALAIIPAHHRTTCTSVHQRCLGIIYHAASSVLRDRCSPNASWKIESHALNHATGKPPCFPSFLCQLCAGGSTSAPVLPSSREAPLADQNQHQTLPSGAHTMWCYAALLRKPLGRR